MDSEPITAEQALARQNAFLRSLAVSLLGDEHLADDVVQATWLASLEEERPVRSYRAWAAGVVRNLARKTRRNTRRRIARERKAAVPEAQPPAEQSIAHAEILRAVTDAVLDLEEPYRSTVLMRYFEGLMPTEIARRTGVPVATVRSRIQRALLRLRTRLDRQHGGRRALLAPLGLPASLSPALWGALVIMKTKTKFLLAGSLLLAGFLGIYAGSLPADPAVPRRGIEGVSAQADLDSARQVLDDLNVARTALDPGEDAVEIATGELVVQVTWRDNGQPAAHVGFQVRRPGDWRPGVMAATDSTGTARLESMQPGPVTVFLDRLGSIWEAEIVAGEEKSVQIEVPRAMDARGIVVDPTGVPVAGAQVFVATLAIEPQWLYPSTTTAEDGTFFLRSLGDKLVAAQARGYGTSDFARARSDQAVNGVAEVRLVLPGQPAELMGRVYDPEGNPLPGAHVSVGRLRLTGNGPPQVLLQTDAEGGFHLRDLKPDRYPVFVYARGFAPWNGFVDCLPRATAELRVEVAHGADVYGTVEDGEGKPLPGVTLDGPSSPWPHGSRNFTDETGAYRFEDLPEGEVTVTAISAQLDRQARTVHVVAGQDRQLDFVMNAGPQIRGILLDPEGEPLAGFWVIHAKGSRSGITDEEGRFVLSNCEPGRLYSVRVQGGMGFLPALHVFQNVVPSPEEQTFRIPETSVPRARITGRLLAPPGVDYGHVSLGLSQEGRHVIPTRRTDDLGRPTGHVHELGYFEMGPVDDSGAFQVGPLPPGTYELRASLTDFLPVDFGSITLAPGELHQLPDTRLRPGARLAVTLQGTEDQRNGLKVELVSPSGETIASGSVREERASFPALEPGPYTLSVTGPAVEAQLLPIELEAGKTLSLDVDLR